MSIPEIAKIKWRCRLGMLELDTLFLDYVRAREQSLTVEQWQALSELLEMDNHVLEQWLIKDPRSVEPKYAALCADIVAVAQCNGG